MILSKSHHRPFKASLILGLFVCHDMHLTKAEDITGVTRSRAVSDPLSLEKVKDLSSAGVKPKDTRQRRRNVKSVCSGSSGALNSSKGAERNSDVRDTRADWVMPSTKVMDMDKESYMDMMATGAETGSPKRQATISFNPEMENYLEGMQHAESGDRALVTKQNDSTEDGRKLAAPAVGAAAAACFATTAAAGVCIALASLVVGLIGLFSGLGDSESDNAWLTITTGTTDNAEGNALAIAYHRAGERDNDRFGWIGKGESKVSWEDLDSKLLREVELYLVDNNDICIRNIIVTVGKEPSGTGLREQIDIPAWILSAIIERPMRPDCVWFGDHEASLTNFKFHWPTALQCYKDYFRRDDDSYFNCFTWAMDRYDLIVNGRFERWVYG